MSSLKAKLTLLVLTLTILSALPVPLRADGFPFPSCGPNSGYCAVAK
jgi:hypothetical protein